MQRSAKPSLPEPQSHLRHGDCNNSIPTSTTNTINKHIYNIDIVRKHPREKSAHRNCGYELNGETKQRAWLRTGKV